MTETFLPMVAPSHIPETRFIADAERAELLALYAEGQALADFDGETGKGRTHATDGCKTTRKVCLPR